MAIDAAVLLAAFVLACAIRSAMLDGDPPSAPLLHNHLWLLWVIVPVWLLALQGAGMYDSLRYSSYRAFLRRLGAAHALAGVTLLSVLFIAHAWGVSRLVVQLFLVLSFLALAGEKAAVLTAQRRAQASGRSARNVLVVGTNGLSSRYLARIAQHPFWGLRVIGCLADASPSAAATNGTTAANGDKRRNGHGHRGANGAPSAPPAGKPPLLGGLEDLREILVSRPVDEVAFALPGAPAELLAPALRICLEKGVTARIVVDVPEVHHRHMSVEMLRDLPVLSFPATPPLGAAIVLKRAMDVLGALAGLAVFGIVYCLYGRRIRRESPGPVLFKQTRIGQNGRRFVLYKFRTMANGAQAEQTRLARANEMHGPIFKVKDDPRITPVGRSLRARYLDELPQFWNVLRGEMSLVGTRPPTPDEVDRYHLSDHGRLAWKPGLTGMWQVNGNRDVPDFDDVVRLDREYIENWSLGLDLKILARTVGKVLRAEGW